MSQIIPSAKDPIFVSQPVGLSISNSDVPQCPMRASTSLSSGRSSAQCPVPHDSSTLDPRNNMPVLSQSPAPNQVGVLPTTRVTSSIPRSPDSIYPGVDPKSSDTDMAASKWEYPSPQQFYNALIRKGWDTPEENVEAMVLIHNRLNEDAWNEVLKWESRVGGGSTGSARLELAEFAGIHGTLSHKAQLYQLARRFFPSHFSLTPPFDRHDWVVRRPGTNKKVRYVIDYYSSRKSMKEEAEFHLDVRPAMDSLENIKMRLVAAIGDICSGVVTRCHSSSVQVPWLRTTFCLLFVSLTLTILVCSPFKIVHSL